MVGSVFPWSFGNTLNHWFLGGGLYEEKGRREDVDVFENLMKARNPLSKKKAQTHKSLQIIPGDHGLPI